MSAATFTTKQIADGRRRDQRLRRLTAVELDRERGYWDRRRALAEEEAEPGCLEIWRLLCEVNLAMCNLELLERERASAAGARREDRTGGVPAWVIADIKQRLDLADLITRWGLTDLRPIGNRYVGCCPFHEERTPSFSVYPDQHFYCFGCEAHGDVFDIAMRHGPWLSFRDAAEGLADAAGVNWPPAETTPILPQRSPPHRRRKHGATFPT